MKRASIGLRLTLWYAALLAIALAAFSLVAGWQLRSAVLQSADSELARVAAGVEKIVRANAGPGAASELNEELNEYAEELRPGIPLDVRIDGRKIVANPDAVRAGAEHRRRVRNFTIAGHRVELSARLSIRTGLAMISGFRRIVTICAPLLLLFSCGAGYWISRRALRPVDAITDAARSIGAHNLSQRLALPSADDELRRLSEAWNEMLARLEGSVQRLTRFSADASHEMRSPLTVIRTTAELALRRERTADEYRDALSGVHRQSERLTALVDDLLALARADQDPNLVLAAVDLGAVVRDAIGTLPKQNDVSVIVESSERALIAGHEPSICRLALILVDNAIKYSPAGGTVLIRIQPRGPSEFELAVEDAGPGIAAEDLPHIFERFYRSDSVRTPGATGTGLGLSIAQSIARAHGRTIDVDTAADRGSMFRIAFRAWSEGVRQ